MVSARQPLEDVRVAIDAGVNGYVLRPFEAGTLERSIAEMIAPAEGDAKAA